MLMIRRMNLDAFWSRARTTVRENGRRVRQALRFSNSLGLEGPYLHEGPYPYYDHCGYEIAAIMLMHSSQPGKHSNSHVQYDTIRKSRSSYSNHVRASPQANLQHLSVLDQRGRYQKITTDKCGSLWFERFLIGMRIRMGNIWKPNKGLSIDLLLTLIGQAEGKIASSEDEDSEHKWIVFVGYIVVTYVLSLRGNEGFMLDLGGLIKQWRIDRKEYLIVVLIGKLKGENELREHLIPCSKFTKSGINVEYTLKRLMLVKEKKNITSGPAISDMNGYLLGARDIDLLLHELLYEIFESSRALFPPNITSFDDIAENYKCNRSLRRTSDTRAIEEKVDSSDIEIVNRWNQRALQKKVAGQAMKHHYAQFELLVKPFLRYTLAM